MTVKVSLEEWKGLAINLKGQFLLIKDLLDDLTTGAIDCCGKFTQNCKGMLQGLDSMTLILK
jgi:hypothetical protein